MLTAHLPACAPHGACALNIICQRCGGCIAHCVCPPSELRWAPRTKKDVAMVAAANKAIARMQAVDTLETRIEWGPEKPNG